MKVYGMLVTAPHSWGVERADNGSAQVRAVCAAKSAAEFRRRLAAHGCEVSVAAYNHGGCETGNAREIEVATSAVGTVFHEVSAKSGIHPLRPAPLKES